MDKNRFVPRTWDARSLLPEEFFRRYVEYDFTAELEEKLDLVSAGELDWKALLREFWASFHAAVGEIGELRTNGRRLTRSTRLWGPTSSRRDPMDRIRAAAPAVARVAFAEDGPLWRLHRLLQLPRMPLHPPDRDLHRW